MLEFTIQSEYFFHTASTRCQGIISYRGIEKGSNEAKDMHR